MKELSIEEKARAYDEALERAKYCLTTDMDDSGHWAVKHIFPELKENEDERMRNIAIYACKYMVDNFENSTKQYEDAIAWLEKQCEKPKWTEEDEENFRDIICAIHRVAYQTSEDEKARIKWIKSIKQRMNDKRRKGKCRK